MFHEVLQKWISHFTVTPGEQSSECRNTGKAALFLHLYHEGRDPTNSSLQTPTISSLLCWPCLGRQGYCV